MQSARGQVELIGQAAQTADGKMRSLLATAAASAAGMLGIGSGLASLGFGIKAASDFEQAEISFTTMLGSARQAKQMMAGLQQFAAETPFELPGIVGAARSLVAFGVEQENVLPTLRAIGDVASGIGAPLGEIAEIYGKARVQGRLFAQDVNQLTGRGIPIIQELAKQFGVAESAVRNLVESGAVNFSHLERAFVDLTSDGGKFANLMQVQSQSIGGLFSTLKDAVTSALRTVGASFLKAADAGATMQRITKTIENLTQLASRLGTVLGTVARWVMRVVEFFSRWATLFGAVVAAGFIFITVLSTTYTIWKLVTLASLAYWAINTVAAWAGTTAAALAYAAATGVVRLATKAATLAVIAFHAFSGPTGWAILAGGAVVFAAAVVGIKAAFDSAASAGTNFAGAVADPSVYDAAALVIYEAELQQLAENLRNGEISAESYRRGLRLAGEVLRDKTQAAREAAAATVELANEQQRLAELAERAKEVISDLGGWHGALTTKVQELRAMLAAGVLTLNQYEQALHKLQLTEDPGKKLVASLREQVDLFGLSARAADIQRARMEGSNTNDIGEAMGLDRLLTQKEKLQEVREFLAELDDQITDFGKSAQQAQLDRLVRGGGVPEVSERVLQARIAELELLERQKELQRELEQVEKDRLRQAERIIEQTRTPLERYGQEIRELAELLADGLIDRETYERAASQTRRDTLGESGRPNQAALERGSAAAFSALVNARKRDPIDRVAANTAEAVQQAKEQTLVLRKIDTSLEREQQEIVVNTIG